MIISLVNDKKSTFLYKASIHKPLVCIKCV